MCSRSHVCLLRRQGIITKGKGKEGGGTGKRGGTGKGGTTNDEKDTDYFGGRDTQLH